MSITLFQPRPELGSINGLIKKSADLLVGMATENDAHWNARVKLSEENIALKREKELTKLAFDLASRGDFDYREIPSWVAKTSATDKSVDYWRELHSIHRRRGSLPSAEAAEKTSSVREDAPTKTSSSDRMLSALSELEAIASGR